MRPAPPSLAFMALLTLAAPSTSRAAPSVELHPAIGRPSRVTITGRVLQSDPEAKPGAPLSKNLHRLTGKSLEHAPVEIEFEGQVHRATSGDDGEFQVTFSAPDGRPFPAGRLPVRASVRGGAGQSSVEVVSDRAPFLVISDFDDTLAVSNIQKTGAMLHSALLEDAATQPAVDGMAELFRCLRESSDPPPGFAIVTGSPISFYRRLEAFLGQHHFPFAGLYLRRWSLRTMSHFKEPVLRRLLREFPQPVVLVGDSGERDPEVYAALRQEFPGRVSAVFIRDLGRSADAGRFSEMVLFGTAARAAREAATRGLIRRNCLESAFPEPAASGR